MYSGIAPVLFIWSLPALTSSISFHLHDDGQFLNPSRLEYKMPRTYEMPEVEYIIVESIDPYGPFGAKEVGEGPIVVTVGAIATAVSNAVGAYIPEMPMTPWKVLRVIRQQQRKTQRAAGDRVTAA